jgi:hypothetical protein
MRHHDGHRVTVLVAGCAAAGLVLCACAAPATPSTRSSSPPASSTPSVSAALGARVNAVTAYRGMWQAMARAGQTSDWRSSELGRYATGDALTAITKSLYGDQFNHVVTRGAPVNIPAVRSAEPPQNPETVLIDDCGDTTHWLKYFAGTNTPVDDLGGGHRSITAEVRRQPDGSWRVTRFAVDGLGTC